MTEQQIDGLSGLYFIQWEAEDGQSFISSCGRIRGPITNGDYTVEIYYRPDDLNEILGADVSFIRERIMHECRIDWWPIEYLATVQLHRGWYRWVRTLVRGWLSETELEANTESKAKEAESNEKQDSKATTAAKTAAPAQGA